MALDFRDFGIRSIDANGKQFKGIGENVLTISEYKQFEDAVRRGQFTETDQVTGFLEGIRGGTEGPTRSSIGLPSFEQEQKTSPSRLREVAREEGLEMVGSPSGRFLRADPDADAAPEGIGPMNTDGTVRGMSDARLAMEATKAAGGAAERSIGGPSQELRDMSIALARGEQPVVSQPEYVSFDTASGKAYFRQTEAGPQAVTDPSVMKGLQSGQIPTSDAGATPTAADSFANVVLGGQGATETTTQTYDGLSDTYLLPPAPIAENEFINDPVTFINNMMNQIYTMMGMGEANVQIDSTTKELETLENKRDREIRQVNDDPWLTEGARVRKIEKVNQKHSDEINNKINRLRLLEDTRNNAQQQAQFALGTAINLFDKERNFQAQQVQAYYDRAQQEFENKIALQSLEIAEEEREFQRELAQQPKGEMGDWLFQVENGQTDLGYFEWSKQLAASKRAPVISGAGLGALGISPSVATEIPTFDEWIARKEQEALQTFSQATRDKMRDEYDGEVELIRRAAATASLSPLAAEMLKNPKNFFTLTPTVKGEILTELAVSGIDTGRIQEGKKQKLSATQSDDLIQARIARDGVLRLKTMLDELQATGPVIGRARQSNPYDPQVVAITAEIRRIVPGLARGVFKEVGVLTDSDVERYTQTLANPTATPEQIEQLHNDTMSKIDNSIRTITDTYGALGYDLGTFDVDEALSETGGESVGSTATQADVDYVNSLTL